MGREEQPHLELVAVEVAALRSATVGMAADRQVHQARAAAADGAVTAVHLQAQEELAQVAAACFPEVVALLVEVDLAVVLHQRQLARP